MLLLRREDQQVNVYSSPKRLVSECLCKREKHSLCNVTAFAFKRYPAFISTIHHKHQTELRPLNNCTLTTRIKHRISGRHPLEIMLPTNLLAAALVGFVSNSTTMPTTFFDKIAFDLDHIGRARQTSLIEETTRIVYTQKGIPVNVAIWNMHIPESHYFHDILETGLQPMGRGGGFRVVVFTGKGWLENRGGREQGDWRFSGNRVVNNGLVNFRDVGGEGWWGWFWRMGNEGRLDRTEL
jgi:hypothetical protein